MKILFIMPNGFYARNFASVIESLARNHHKVLVALEFKSEPDGTEETPSAAKDVLRSYLPNSHRGRIEVIRLPKREPSSLWGGTSEQTAALWDYSRYLLPLHRFSARCATRAESFLWPSLRSLIRVSERQRERTARAMARVCAWIQEILPPNRDALGIIRTHDPDIVLITPLIDLGSDQTDYVKACRRLRIPIGHCVASWDNLTNKGLIKAAPDRVFVWNEAQKTEAISLHGIPQSRVVITGAQIFDHWFESRHTTSRVEFCAKAGLDPSKLILLYAASSVFICRSEVDFVLKWLHALRSCNDVRLQEAGIIIRPHPKAQKSISQWEHPALKEFKNVVVFPQGDDLTLARRSHNDYYNSLFHSAAVVGINTSAMLEASIVGRRCFTILLDEVREGQDGMVHFQHLTRGGFLGTAQNLEEHIEQLSEELDGRDDRISAFVESFLRPYGIDQAATPVFVAEVEEMEDLAIEGPSLCARLGWIQRPLLLPIVGTVGLVHAMLWMGGAFQRLYKKLYKSVFRPGWRRTRSLVVRVSRLMSSGLVNAIKRAAHAVQSAYEELYNFTHKAMAKIHKRGWRKVRPLLGNVLRALGLLPRRTDHISDDDGPGAIVDDAQSVPERRPTVELDAV